jgi:hypothetical protein
MLDIDPKNTPSTAAIRRTLATLLDHALGNHKLCRHMTDGRRPQFRAFAYSGICRCFKRPNQTLHPEMDVLETGKCSTCKCERQPFLNCQDCGAIYAWHLAAGRITLTYRYEWQFWKPTSPGWLNLLDDMPHGGGVFHQSNRHILWCDEPGCATAREPRWDNLIKEGTWLHHIRYGSGLVGLNNEESRDYEILWSRYHGLPGQIEGACYSMPEHTLGSAYRERTKDILFASRHGGAGAGGSAHMDYCKTEEDLRRELFRKPTRVKVKSTPKRPLSPPERSSPNPTTGLSEAAIQAMWDRAAVHLRKMSLTELRDGLDESMAQLGYGSPARRRALRDKVIARLNETDPQESVASSAPK